MNRGGGAGGHVFHRRGHSYELSVVDNHHSGDGLGFPRIQGLQCGAELLRAHYFSEEHAREFDVGAKAMLSRHHRTAVHLGYRLAGDPPRFGRGGGSILDGLHELLSLGKLTEFDRVAGTR